MTSHQERNMRIKYRSLFQSLSIISLGLALCLAVYSISKRSATGAPGGQNYVKLASKDAIDMSFNRWQDRAPRSLSKDYENYMNENTIENEHVIDKSALDLQYYDRHNLSSILLNTIVATATAKPVTDLSDIFISVKTTRNFHKLRLDVILKTWFNLAKEQTWFFSDIEDSEYQIRTGGHLVNTNCSASHSRRALCCKMAREFDTFLESNKKWWCHFDDDNYVNVEALLKTLGDYDPLQDWYLGKPSIRAPLEIINRDNVSQKISFWFGTGGAGFCISRSLGLKMMPVAGGGKFISVGEKIRLPDDVTMGYIIEHILRKKLTVVDEFHSHLEPMRFVNTDTLHDQISFSYSQYGSEMNVLPIEGLDHRIDPTRFLSLHCLLHPTYSFCPR